MFTISGNKIYLTCGDSATILVTAATKTGELYEFHQGDSIQFTLKRTNQKCDNNILLQKTTEIEAAATSCEIVFVPSDTKELNFGKYYYDIQLTTVDGWVDTIIPASIFEIGAEIG